MEDFSPLQRGLILGCVAHGVADKAGPEGLPGQLMLIVAKMADMLEEGWDKRREERIARAREV
jgi:hypothetical protein